MTDKADEGARGPQEGGEQPTPSVPSESTGDQLPSTPSRDEAGVATQVAQLTSAVEDLKRAHEELPDTVERLVQGTKDRRFRTLQGIDPDTLVAFKGYLDQFEGDFERATRELQLDMLLQAQSGRSTERAQGSASGGEATATDEELAGISADVLTKAGIAFNDPAYNQFVQENVGRRFTKEQWEDAVESWAFKRLRQIGAPPGAVVSERGSPPAPANLQQEYEKEVAALRGSRNYARLVEVKRKYRQLGLDV